jgi:hypothetical protein
VKPWADRARARLDFESKDIERKQADQRLVVNLVGAPGAGKSTLAAAYCQRNPGWQLLTIDHYMLTGGLDYHQAWESLITHSRLYDRVIVESSGIGKHLRRLLKYRHHATLIVTSSVAKARRTTRIKERNKMAEAFGTQDELEVKVKGLPTIYPKAEVFDADGSFEETYGRFAAAMTRATARAAAGGDPTPTMPRKHRVIPNSDPKRQARKKVERALRSGKLTRPAECERCGKAGKVQGHHDDHSRPLEVRWLCLPCHRLVDRQLERAASRGA